MITQKAKRKQVIVEYAQKYSKSAVAQKYETSLSSIKRRCKQKAA